MPPLVFDTGVFYVVAMIEVPGQTAATVPTAATIAPGVIASRLVAARNANHVLFDYPGPMPCSLHEAYAIQDAAIALVDDHVAGWKVGRVLDEHVAGVGANRLAGPIFARRILQAPSPAGMPVLSGFAAVEAELLLRIGPGAHPVPDAAAAAELVDEVRLGIEIASSPFPGINAHGPAVTVSDFGNNHGLLLGPVVADWQGRDLLGAATELWIDGALAGTGRAADMLDGPFGAVAFLLNLLAARGISVPPGTWVSTGAITGVHPIHAGQSAMARFDGRETLSVDIVATAIG